MYPGFNYILACLSRGKDEVHLTSNERQHIIASVFYTKKYNIINLNEGNDKPVTIIVRIIAKSGKINDFLVNEHPYVSNCYEIVISLIQFIQDYHRFNFKFLDNLEKNRHLASHYQIEYIKTILDIKSMCSNTLFVFQDINWHTLQQVCKVFGLDLSGGTISKRHLLSSSNYNLSKYLIKLNYTDADVYASYKYFNDKNFEDVRVNETLVNQISTINYFRSFVKEGFNEKLTQVDSIILQKNSQLKEDEKSLESLNTELNKQLSFQINQKVDQSSKAKIELKINHIKHKIDECNSICS